MALASSVALLTMVPPHDHDHDHGAAHGAEPVHNCIHGSLHKDTPIILSTQNYASASPSEKQYDFGAFNGALEWPSDGLESSAVNADMTVPKADWKNLRIKIIDDALYDDPGHTCFRYGQDYWDQGKRKSCSWGEVLTQEKRDTLAKVLMPQAVEFFSQLLRVRPVQGALRLHSFNCGFEGGVRVPSWLRDEGTTDADMIIFLTARPISMSETIAYAGHCETDQYGRPIAAHFNWSPAQLQTPHNKWMEQYLLRVGMHELTHALVFSPNLIAAFPNQVPPVTAVVCAVRERCSADGMKQLLTCARPTCPATARHAVGLHPLRHLRDVGGIATRAACRAEALWVRQLGGRAARGWRRRGHRRLALGDALVPRRVHDGLRFAR